MANINSWAHISVLPQWISSPNCLKWIRYKQSMTEQMRQQGSLTVELRQHQNNRPYLEEAQRLEIPQSTALIREVILSVDQSPWIFGRSIFPLTAIDGAFKAFKTLGDTPLGDLLFQQSVERSEFDICKLNRDNLYFPHQESSPLIARRSVFSLGNDCMLLTEIFLPAMMRKLSE